MISESSQYVSELDVSKTTGYPLNWSHFGFIVFNTKLFICRVEDFWRVKFLFLLTYFSFNISHCKKCLTRFDCLHKNYI